ncbi:MAG: adenylate/guanylate cyclase domain-containing protein [Myxococcota bacterium]
MTRSIRLWSGLVMFAYVCMHLANHALGLVSLQAMETALQWHMAVWRSMPGKILLYGSMTLHIVVAMTSILQRRTLRMPPWQMAQHALGALIPVSLAGHVAATTVAHGRLGVSLAYVVQVHRYWVEAPGVGVSMFLAVILVWLHGCVGIHYWLRLAPWYPRVSMGLYSVALVVPLLAILGVTQAGREVAALVDNPAVWVALQERHTFTTPEAKALSTEALAETAVITILVAAGVLLARAARDAFTRSHGARQVTYPDGRRVAAPRGVTLLDVSRLAEIPHASVCGGRGRCSTCRVRVLGNMDGLTPPSVQELRVLGRVGAGPQVRLACQARLLDHVQVAPLVPVNVVAHQSLRREDSSGQELEIAILFADLRGFTQMSEGKLPYDLVFILNRYFAAMGEAVEAAGGRVDKFIGDGVMALFGTHGSPESACREALVAARLMATRLMDLNAALAHDLPSPLRIGIGIHTGPAVVGEMGYSRVSSLTAIGDAVNTASRLEALTKDYDCQLVVSDAVAQRAGVDLRHHPSHQIQVRGRMQPLTIFAIQHARDLGEVLQEPRQLEKVVA